MEKRLLDRINRIYRMGGEREREGEFEQKDAKDAKKEEEKG
jgi:hypothetical protein